MNCPNCKNEMYQEHTKMYDRNHPENTTMIDNWHCKSCKSVFTNKEIKDKDDWSKWRTYKSGKDTFLAGQERSMSEHLESCCGCSFCEPDEKE